ncbi:MAG TPA: Hsp20/alpha crystallin family protein [bacterium]|nr:Hsp20/alpha crystallin family protein [bacterium]
MVNLFKKNKTNSYKISTFNEDEEASFNWLGEELAEGQLLVDVYQTPDNIIVKSTMAGVKPENLFISLNHDILTIKGKREHENLVDDNDYLLRECYFGSFSRTIILPDEVDSKKIEAILENGVLTVVLEKMYKDHQVKVKIK